MAEKKHLIIQMKVLVDVIDICVIKMLLSPVVYTLKPENTNKTINLFLAEHLLHDQDSNQIGECSFCGSFGGRIKN